MDNFLPKKQPIPTSTEDKKPQKNPKLYKFTKTAKVVTATISQENLFNGLNLLFGTFGFEYPQANPRNTQMMKQCH